MHTVYIEINKLCLEATCARDVDELQNRGLSESELARVSQSLLILLALLPIQCAGTDLIPLFFRYLVTCYRVQHNAVPQAQRLCPIPQLDGREKLLPNVLASKPIHHTSDTPSESRSNEQELLCAWHFSLLIGGLFRAQTGHYCMSRFL